MARAAADGNNLPGASAAVGGSDDNSRRGRMLMGKGRGLARRRRHAIKFIFTKLRNSFVEFNGTGEDDDEKNMCLQTGFIWNDEGTHIAILSITVIHKLPHEQFDLVNKNNMTF